MNRTSCIVCYLPWGICPASPMRTMKNRCVLMSKLMLEHQTMLAFYTFQVQCNARIGRAVRFLHTTCHA